MKKNYLMILAFAATFALGYAFNTIISKPNNDTKVLKRATGIGGIFFKCKDPAKTREWYKVHLGLNVNQYGTSFSWFQGADSTKRGYTEWSPFKETTTYFAPSTRDFMINYRVADLEGLVKEFKKEGVQIVDTIAAYPYGKFLHVLDGEGNKIELWEPNDTEYAKISSSSTQ